MLSIETVVTSHGNAPESEYLRHKLYTLHGGEAGATTEHISLYLRDADGHLCGGLLAQRYWNCMFAEILWVDPRYRGLGHGPRLMNELEALSRATAVDIIHLDAPGDAAARFHSKLGYQVFGVLDDTPQGERRYFMAKRLDDRPIAVSASPAHDLPTC
jgi:GNAT superfamily N-acetyltransferase